MTGREMLEFLQNLDNTDLELPLVLVLGFNENHNWTVGKAHLLPNRQEILITMGSEGPKI